jgi:hypothetical protein
MVGAKQWLSSQYRTSAQPRRNSPQRGGVRFSTLSDLLETLHRVFHSRVKAEFMLRLSFCWVVGFGCLQLWLSPPPP